MRVPAALCRTPCTYTECILSVIHIRYTFSIRNRRLHCSPCCSHSSECIAPPQTTTSPATSIMTKLLLMPIKHTFFHSIFKNNHFRLFEQLMYHYIKLLKCIKMSQLLKAIKHLYFLYVSLQQTGYFLFSLAALPAEPNVLCDVHP